MLSARPVDRLDVHILVDNATDSLFDTGPEADTFERNTRQLGLDLGVGIML